MATACKRFSRISTPPSPLARSLRALCLPPSCSPSIPTNVFSRLIRINRGRSQKQFANIDLADDELSISLSLSLSSRAKKADCRFLEDVTNCKWCLNAPPGEVDCYCCAFVVERKVSPGILKQNIYLTLYLSERHVYLTA